MQVLPHFRFELFDGGRLHCGTQGAVVLGSRARALLAILSLSRERRVDRERLLGLLWPQRGNEQARASLRQCVHEIRHAQVASAPELVVARRDSVEIAADVLITDIERIEAAAGAGDDAALLTELQRIGGDRALAGLDFVDSFDEWATGARAALETRLAKAVHGRLAGLEAAGAAVAVAALCDIWLARDDTDEQAVAAAVRIDVARGARASALRRIKQLETALRRDELGAPGRAVFDALGAAAGRGAVAAEVPALAAAAPAAADPARPIDVLPPLLGVARFFDTTGEAPPHMLAALRDEVLSGLSRFRDLRLAAAHDAATCDYMLVTSLRWTPTAIAASVQLRRGGAGAVVWANRFDLAGAEIQSGIDVLVGRIVTAALPALTSDVITSVLPKPTAGIYSRYLVARHGSLRPADHDAARATAAELEAIIAEAPHFAPPMMALARIYDTDFVWTRAGSSGAAERDRGLELARAALALDRGDVNAWTHVGWGHLWHGNWAAAEYHFSAAVALRPFNVTRLLEVVFGRVFLGELDAAAALLDDCLELDPRPGDGFYGDRGLLRMICGEYDAASQDFDLVADPDLIMSIHAAANAALAGRPSRPLRRLAEAKIAAIHPDGRMPSLPKLRHWVDAAHPFRNDAHRARLRAGIDAAFR